MNHPAELTLAQYMTDAANGKAVMSDATIEKIGKDVMDALKRQFGGGTKRKDFALRMSNVGRPLCQLQMEAQNIKGEGQPYNVKMRNTFGDLIEALSIFVLKSAAPETVTVESNLAAPVTVRLDKLVLYP